MNIYDYFNKPNILNGYCDRLHNVPMCAHQYVVSINARFPEGEKAIASDPYYAYYYARYVIRGKFPEGENAIASDPWYAYLYARYVISEKFPEGENAIASDPEQSYYYARYVICERFPEGEKTINSNLYYKARYQEFLNSL